MLSFKDDARDIQKFLLQYAKDRPHCVWGADMGMGKTVTALTYAKYLLQTKQTKKILIVAPKRVVKYTWLPEAKLWDHLQDFALQKITGEQDIFCRQIAASSKCKVHVVNREMLPWLWTFFGEGKRFPYDTLIYDEGSRLKSWKKRTPNGSLSEYGVLATARKTHFKKVLVLSGTPAPNGLIDLGGLMYIVDLGERLGINLSRYREKYFNYNQYNHSLTPKEFAFDEIMSKVSDVMVTVKTGDYAKLPETINILKTIDLPDNVQKQYNKLQREYVLAEHDLHIKNGAELTQKLLQLANGSFYVTNELTQETVTKELHTEKLKVLHEIIDSAEGKPILLAYSYQFDKQMILKEFKQAIAFDDSDDIVDRWNAGKIPLLIAHPASIGHGLNMQKGSNIVVWYGLTWSLELYKQFNARLVRPGQSENHVFLYHILANNTYDMKVIDILQRKDSAQDLVLEALKVTAEQIKEVANG